MDQIILTELPEGVESPSPESVVAAYSSCRITARGNHRPVAGADPYGELSEECVLSTYLDWARPMDIQRDISIGTIHA